MGQPKNVDATFYVQIAPEWYASGALAGAVAERITQNRPRTPKPGTVTIALTVRIPAGAFLPLRPEAVVVIPEGMTVTTPIEAVAEDPS